MTRTMNMTAGRDYSGYNRKRVWLAGLILFVFLLIFSAVFFSKTVTAQRSGDRFKLVTSVEIKKGDTLWSIATEYITDEYSNLNEYINEIKDTNGLVSDTIHAGNYILVPYYADASK
jgi:cell division protein YceG involved in septum cleavage